MIYHTYHNPTKLSLVRDNMKRILAVVILGLAVLLSFSATASGASKKPDETPAQKVTALVQPSVVYINSTWSAKIYDSYAKALVRDQSYTLTASCTGFVVSPDGYIATAGHCVNARDDKYQIDLRYDLLDKAIADVENTPGGHGYGNNLDHNSLVDYAVAHWKLLDPSAETIKVLGEPVVSANVTWGSSVSGLSVATTKAARIIDHSTFNNGDIALLKVEADGLNALPLGGDKAETGTDVTAIGYPGKVSATTDPDLNASFKTGTVSSYHTVGSGLTSVYEISAAVGPGMSGGPTVTNDGKVLGINSFVAVDQGSGATSEAFNFVRPVSLLKEMMAKSGAKDSLSATSKTYFAGLKAYYAGDKKTAKKDLAKVVDEQPANGIAKTYLDKAKKLPNPPPPKKSSHTGLIIGVIVIVLLIVLAIVGFLLWRRRRSTAAPTPAPAPVPAPVPAPSEVPAQRAASPTSAACPSCGTQNAPGTRFCGNCGTQL